MVITYRDDTLDRGGGDLPRPLRRRGVYLKDYEFLEFHEWWTERETVQAKGWRGLII